MRGAGIDAQVRHLAAAQRTARDHALNGLFKHALGEAAIQHLGGGHFLDAAGVASVLVIGLLLQLVARQLDLAGVDHDDMIAAIDVRGEARLVLAAQMVGDDHGETPDHQSFGIDQMPLLFHLGRFDRPGDLGKRLHGHPLSEKRSNP